MPFEELHLIQHQIRGNGCHAKPPVKLRQKLNPEQSGNHKNFPPYRLIVVPFWLCSINNEAKESSGGCCCCCFTTKLRVKHNSSKSFLQASHRHDCFSHRKASQESHKAIFNTHKKTLKLFYVKSKIKQNRLPLGYKEQEISRRQKKINKVELLLAMKCKDLKDYLSICGFVWWP